MSSNNETKWLRAGLPTATSLNDYGLNKRMRLILRKVNFDGKGVLDIGCGNGIYSLFISRKAKRVCGIDINRLFLKNAIIKRETQSIDLVLMNGFDLGFPDETFDVAVLIEVFEHVDNRKKLLSEVYRVLRTGGQIVVSAPNRFFPMDTHSVKIFGKKIEPPIPFFPFLPDRIRDFFVATKVFTQPELKHLLTDSGFKKIDTHCMFPYFGSNGSPLKSALRTISDRVEDVSPINIFGMIIYATAEK